jgi:hypothetical protein
MVTVFPFAAGDGRVIEQVNSKDLRKQDMGMRSG